MRKAKKAGLVGAVSAAGVGTALAVGKYAVGRVRVRRENSADESFGGLRGRELTVLASDGIPLHTEVEGADNAALTVVFCHGYALQQDAWHFQRRDLAADRDLRLVFWDQRCHGRSGRGEVAHSTIDQCGEDLYSVLRATVRPGDPVVLVGHSMGAMTIMALADRHPELFGDQIVAAAFLNTSAGDLSEVTFGFPRVFGRVMRMTAPGVVRTLGKRAAIVDRTRELGADFAYLVTRRMGFGSKEANPAVVDFVERMIRATPIDVVAEFYPALMAHDKHAALPVLNSIPILVITADCDRLTPADHGREIAEAIPTAELVEVKQAGHVVMLEHPDLVTEVLGELLDEVRARPEERTA